MGASLIPGTCFNSCGCFLPDLTRLATLQCGEARRSLFYLISRPDEAVKRENKFGLVIANKLRYNAAPLPGEVDEWFKSPPWKGGTGVTLSRVRIPPSPPNTRATHAVAFLFRSAVSCPESSGLIFHAYCSNAAVVCAITTLYSRCISAAVR